MKLRYGSPELEEPAPTKAKDNHLFLLGGVSAVLDVLQAATMQIGKHGESPTLPKSLGVTAALAKQMVDNIRESMAQAERDSDADAALQDVEDRASEISYWPKS
jgi:hypothetical protein